MSDEKIEELKATEEVTNKTRQKVRVRGVLIVVNALLLAYVGFLSVQTIVQTVKSNKSSSDGAVIAVLGKNEKKSLEIYNKLICKDENGQNQSVKIADVATYGKYLLTSEYRVNVNSMHATDKPNVNVKKVDEKKETSFSRADTKVLGDKLDSQLDLYSLDVGEYVLFNDFDFASMSERKVFEYTNTKMLNETIYTIKSKQDQSVRKQITIKGVATSPALVISVNKVSILPAKTYDFVVLNNTNSTPKWLQDLKNNYVVYEAKDLVDAYRTNASYALSVKEGNSIESSSYVSLGNAHPNLITGSTYDGLDDDSFIRELGGKVFNAGYGVEGNKDSIDIKNNLQDTIVGKLALNVGQDVNLDSIITQLGL